MRETHCDSKRLPTPPQPLRIYSVEDDLIGEFLSIHPLLSKHEANYFRSRGGPYRRRVTTYSRGGQSGAAANQALKISNSREASSELWDPHLRLEKGGPGHPV